MSTQLTFKAVLAKQSDTHKVISFAATASQIHQFANIDHVARDSSGTIQGFQRPQIASHINEIRDYLEGDDAVLPNPIVVAFTDRAFVEKTEDGSVELRIDTSNGPPGLVVDGQQRLTALSGLSEKDFQVFVSALICRDEEELRRQFLSLIHI